MQEVMATIPALQSWMNLKGGKAFIDKLHWCWSWVTGSVEARGHVCWSRWLALRGTPLSLQSEPPSGELGVVTFRHYA